MHKTDYARTVYRYIILVHKQQIIIFVPFEVGAKQAWTDVARLGQVGVDAVNFGPGLSAQAHQSGEYIDIGLMVESYGMFRRFLANTG